MAMDSMINHKIRWKDLWIINMLLSISAIAYSKEEVMKKLVLYSDQSHQNNEKVDARLVSLVQKPNARIGYVPSGGDKERKYYQKICEHYKKLGFEDFLFFDLDDEFDPSAIDELLACDIIHLSAGDPIYFIHNISRRNFDNILRHYVAQGGILVGVSGGSLQLTKTVAIYRAFIGSLSDITDEDYVGLSALNLVGFEFLPHYNRWNQEFIDTIKAYSAKFSCLIYACRDGDGIVVNDNNLEFIGDVVKIENGILISSDD